MADPLIPPPPVKIIWFFTHITTNTGWSETYYINSSSVADAITNFATNMVAQRMALMTNKVKSLYARASTLNIKGDGYPIAQVTNLLGTYVPVVADGNHPGVGIWMRWFGPGGQRTMRFQHAVPEENVTDGQMSFTDPYITANAIWQTALQTVCLMKIKTGTPPTTQFIAPVGVTTRYMSVRKVGRPFGLLRGRAAIRT